MADVVMDNFIEVMNWFDTSYEELLRWRFPTMRIALNFLFQQSTHRIVETGSTCRLNDTGSGYSTFIFGDFVTHYGGHLTTIDIEPNVIDACKVITKRFEDNITYICENSLIALAQLAEPIDLLYLDSFDVPEEGDATAGQEHALKEFKIAEDLLHSGSIILLDDNRMTNGGKTRLLKEYLRIKEYGHIFDYHQSLWIK